MNKIRLSSPHITGAEQKYIKKAFQDNNVASYGENIDEFENSLENYLGHESKVAALTSGTSAIHLALILSKVEANDVVLCQNFTFVASVNPILYQGAKPVFVDSENETWNMCPFKLEEAILSEISKGKKPKAIVVVHSYGMPAKITAICKIAQQYDIKVIEDAAEALGASYNGQMCGTFGDYGILSFNGNKIITTSGGGALICKASSDKNKAIFLATQAKDKVAYYQHSEMGFNYRMNNISAGIGRGQLESLENHITSRKEMNNFYVELFKEIEGVIVLKEPNAVFKSNHWLTCIVVNGKKTGVSVEKIRLQLESDNIESRRIWKPMHLQPLFLDNTFYNTGVSEKLFATGLCLPSGSNLTNSDKQRIKASLHKVFS